MFQTTESDCDEPPNIGGTPIASGKNLAKTLIFLCLITNLVPIPKCDAHPYWPGHQAVRSDQNLDTFLQQQVPEISEGEFYNQ